MYLPQKRVTHIAFLITVLAIAVLVLSATALHAQDQPAALPQLPFHLTARPFKPLETSRDAYLDVLELLCRAMARWQDDRGAIVDPDLGREHQYSTPYFAYAVESWLARRAPELRESGVRAVDHATRCLAGGSPAIPDRHGEFFLAPLAGALELYREHVSADTMHVWRERLGTPMEQVLEDQSGRINNWRTYAMKGQWLRSRTGLVDRDAAVAFIDDAWTRRTQRERIVADKWNFYQDWSSDPQSHAVEAVGRGNLLALVAAGYDGPHRDEIARAVRRGTLVSLLWQDPSGQCPPNGRTDNHVFNDVLYQLAFEVMAEDAQARGDLEQAGQLRRAALLSFHSIARWRRTDPQHAGSYFVTKNRFDPRQRVGYQPASQTANYNGAIAYHLAEAVQAHTSPIAERPAPTEIGGYVVTADSQFSSAVANAGGMQVMANLRGDTVPKYGQYWTPLGVVRFARAGWDSRLGPPDGVHDAASGRALTFAPIWQEAGRWVHLAERAEHYRGTLVTEFVHPLLVRFHILYHTVTGQGGPGFRHDFVVTPDGVLATLHCLDETPFGLTLPVIVDDGRRLDAKLARPCITVSYPRGLEQPGDEQCYLLLGTNSVAHVEEPIRSAVGWLRGVRVTNDDRSVAVFVYPRSSVDPPATEVLSSFRVEGTNFSSRLASVRDNVYQGRTSAGGYGSMLTLPERGGELKLGAECNYLLQLGPGGALKLECDRRTDAQFNGKPIAVAAFSSIALPREKPTDSPNR